MEEMLHLLSVFLRALIFLLLLTSCVYGYGNIIYSLLVGRKPLSVRSFLYSVVLGIGGLAHLVLILGVVNLLYSGILRGVLAVGIVFCLYSLASNPIRVQNIGSALSHAWVRRKYLRWFEAALVLLLLLNMVYSLVTNALVPPIASDAVAYHLAAAKLYTQAHSVEYISFIPYSNWPFEVEMLFTLALVLFSEIEAQMITWLCLAILCLAIWYFGAHWLGRPAGLIAAVIFSATPMVCTLSGTGLVEVPLALFTFLAVASLIEWIRDSSNRDWLLSAVFGGLAASTKLNAALVPLLLGLLLSLVMWLEKREKPRQILTRFASYGLAAFGVVSFWYLKSWWQTGDPLWPFLPNLFPTRNWDALGTEYLMSFIQYPNMPLTLKNWLLGIYQLTLNPLPYGPQLVELGWSYLLFLPLAFPALVWSEKNEKWKMYFWLSAIGVVLYTSWFFQTHQTRFLLPVAPVMSLIAAGGIAWLAGLSRQLGKPLVYCALLGYFVAFAWFSNPNMRKNFLNSRAFLAGQQTREEYLRRNSLGYTAYQYANEHLPADAYVWLALYEVRGYYLDRDYMWANPISQRDLKLEQYSSAEELAQELQRRGFTHILFSPNRIKRYLYIQYGPQVTELAKETIARYGRLIYTSEDKDLELYEFHP